jgi:hypothetical protein
MPAHVTNARAIANDDVAILGWDLDVDFLPGLLGFDVVRQYLDDNDQVTDERPLASYVAFEGQSNPGWKPQNTTVWPIQKFTWRDLTLRQKRDALDRHPAGERVRYSVAAVGAQADGMTPVQVVQTAHNTYQGTPLPLGYLTEPALTNVITVGAAAPPFTPTFTRGVLSTQFLLHLLGTPDAHGNLNLGAGVVETRLSTPGDFLREYLSGDVLQLMRDFFQIAGGRFHAALYELDDTELIQLILDNADRIDLILSNSGGTAAPFDSRNAPHRTVLHQRMDAAGSTFTIQDRMYADSGHIGHNKFVVHVDDAGKADAVLTGSTNWTWSGVAGQSNNCTRCDDADVAAAFLDYWNLLHADPIPKAGAPTKTAEFSQSDTVKTADLTPARVDGPSGSTIEVWFSPNVPGRVQPSDTSPPPVDMDRLFGLMRQAQQVILFLVFMPSKGGKNSIVSQAVALGEADTSLTVLGAISDSMAMWQEPGADPAAGVPHIFQRGNVSVVRATALSDKAIVAPIGDFQLGERLAAEHAIIHDKILVLDPLDPQRCLVAFGSHNLGYKASYSNDENLTIVQGNQALAEAYAAHVVDVYDHYRFRARQADSAPGDAWDGLLHKTDTWQNKASRALARYLGTMG